jgi:hypothetical protein
MLALLRCSDFPKLFLELLAPRNARSEFTHCDGYDRNRCLRDGNPMFLSALRFAAVPSIGAPPRGLWTSTALHPPVRFPIGGWRRPTNDVHVDSETKEGRSALIVDQTARTHLFSKINLLY